MAEAGLLAMRVVLSVALLVALAVSGCVESPSEPEAPAVADVSEAPLTHETRVDLAGLVPAKDRIGVVAFQATEDLRFELAYVEEMDYEGGDAYSCHTTKIDVNAPVAFILGEGEAPQTPYGPGGGAGGGGGSADSAIRYEGETVAEVPLGLGSHSSSGGGVGSGNLTAGSWILVAAGLAGIGPEAIGADDTWDLTLRTSAPVQRMDLPDVPFRCGGGFGQDTRTSVLGVPVDPSADLTIEMPYARSLFYWHLDGSAQGAMRFDDEDLPLGIGDPVERFAWGSGTVGFDIQDAGDARVWWMMAGI